MKANHITRRLKNNFYEKNKKMNKEIDILVRTIIQDKGKILE